MEKKELKNQKISVYMTEKQKNLLLPSLNKTEKMFLPTCAT